MIALAALTCTGHRVLPPAPRPLAPPYLVAPPTDTADARNPWRGALLRPVRDAHSLEIRFMAHEDYFDAFRNHGHLGLDPRG